MRYTYLNVKTRTAIREPFAEFLGTAILTLLGIGVNCQTTLSQNTQVANTPKGDWVTVILGWGAAAALGVWVSGGISGGHINPAVTLALATFRGFPWKKVPLYIISQLSGATFAGALAYANYFNAIAIFEGGANIRTLKTASMFSIYPLGYMTGVSAFFSEILCTAGLMIGILTMIDKQHAGPPKSLAPLVLFVTVVAIGASTGMETSFGMNPARDLGPRMITSLVGYGQAVYSFRSQYWLWGEIIAPILGAQTGALVYDVFIYTGNDSVINKSSYDTRPSVIALKDVATVHRRSFDTKVTRPSVVATGEMFN
ncbi:hypothetical protein M378DRAFT_529478 [Amanita muscaria Koide BX008]|uniref:Aquaporin n=1 Tax=Amanita muscaria (strain Koide BX008) TaxID=946122 RepID=A0A0C2X9J7_AMAMK|nr:hypothetical protein M378DRAFT_529478 [Amanita muscaria Koide BX008]